MRIRKLTVWEMLLIAAMVMVAIFGLRYLWG
jgi:hypothetical protein